jgi:hypothetical protein
MGPSAFADGKATGRGDAEKFQVALQWGRQLSPTERPRPRSAASSTTRCFNGAVSFRRRKELAEYHEKLRLVGASVASDPTGEHERVAESRRSSSTRTGLHR